MRCAFTPLAEADLSTLPLAELKDVGTESAHYERKR
jgi:hypothetical protein